MKKQYIAILIACLLLLSVGTSCNEGVRMEPSDLNEEPSSGDATAEDLPATESPDPNEEPSSSGATTEGLPAEYLPIDITYIFGCDEIDWECTNYKHYKVSFEMPESWQTKIGRASCRERV